MIYSFRNLVTSFAITIAVVFLILLYTFYTFQLQQKELANIEISKEGMTKLEVAINHMRKIEYDFKSSILQGDKQPDFFTAGLLDLQKDSSDLMEVANSDSTRKNPGDYQDIVKYLHQMTTEGTSILNKLKTEGSLSAQQEVKKGEMLRVLNNFNKLVDKIESDNRHLMNVAYARNNMLAGKTLVFTAIISGLLILILIAGFLFRYKNLHRRSVYDFNLKKFRNALNNSADGLYIIDRAQMKFIEVNDASSASTGYSREELLTMGPQHLRQLQKEKTLGEEYDKIINSSSKKSLLYATYFRKDGSSFDAEISIQAMKDGEKDILITVVRDITERKRAEQQLQKFNEELEKQVKEKTAEISNVFERVTDAFIALDKEWRYTYLNERAGKMHGCKPEELIGKNIWDEFPDVVNEPLYNALHKAMRTQQSQRLQLYYSTVDKWFEDLIYPSCDGVSVYYHDITEKKKAEEELSRSQEKYSALLNTIEGIVWEADPQTFRFGFVSLQAEKILGYPVQQWMDEPLFWKNHIHPDDQAWAVAYCIDFTRKKKNHEFEYRMIASDGRVVWLRDLVSVIVHDDEVRQLRGIKVDITQRKEAEEKISQSENKFKALIDTSPDATVIVNEEGIIQIVNKQTEIILGYPRKELIGAHVRQLLPEELRDEHKKLRESFYSKPSGKPMAAGREVIALRKDGTMVPVEISLSPFNSEDGVLVTASIRDITDRKRAEEMLRKNERQLSIAANIAKLGYWEYDVLKNEYTFNDQFYSIFKTTADEAGGYVMTAERYMTLLVHPDDADLIKKELIAAEKSTDLNFGRQIEHRIKYANGETGYISVNYFVIKNKEGKIIKKFGVNQDITERKKAEENLQRSNTRFELITSTTNDAVWEWNLETGELWANEMHQHLYGLTHADPIPTVQMWTERLHPDDREKILKKQQEALASDANVFISEYRFKVKGKGYRNIYDRCYIVRNKDRKPINMMGSMMDITEQKSVEEKLRQSEERYRTLIDQAGDAIAMFDRNGKFIDVNNSATQLTGYNKDALQHLYIRDVLLEEDLKNDPVRYDLLEKGEPTIKQRRLRRKDGSIVEIEVHTKMLPDGRFLTVVRDLTERKKVQEQLESSYKEIRQLTDHLQKIREEERKNIAREIHDELGQQLTVLKMDISWLNKRITNADELTSQKLKNLADMLNGTVKSVRRISSELRPSLLDDLGLVATMEWQLKEFEEHSGIKTTFLANETEKQLPDKIKTGLFRIFQESLTNVARHSDAQRVDVNLQQSDNRIVLSIEDNGKGFDKKKTAGKRTLGILGMKERTEMMGGEYEIKSTPGQGTTVLVEIPS